MGRIDWTNAAIGFALAGLLTFLLYLPLLSDVHAFFERRSETTNVATAGWAILETLKGLQLAYMGAGLFAGALVFAVGCWSYLRQSPTVLALFFAPPLVVLATTVLLQHPIRPRFFFFAAGFALLVIMRGARRDRELDRPAYRPPVFERRSGACPAYSRLHRHGGGFGSGTPRRIPSPQAGL